MSHTSKNLVIKKNPEFLKVLSGGLSIKPLFETEVKTPISLEYVVHGPTFHQAVPS